MLLFKKMASQQNNNNANNNHGDAANATTTPPTKDINYTFTPTELFREHFKCLDERCILTHLTPQINSEIFLQKTKSTKMTSVFPTICNDCLSKKFGLTESCSNEDASLLNCRKNSITAVDTTTGKQNVTYSEGPYLRTNVNNNNNNTTDSPYLVFAKNSIIFPVGQWLLDLLYSDVHCLFYHFSYLPRIKYKEIEYSLNPFIYNFFKDLHFTRMMQQQRQQKEERLKQNRWKVKSLNDVLNYCLIPTAGLYDSIYDVEAIMMSLLFNPLGHYSRYITEKKSVLLTENNVLELTMICNEVVVIKGDLAEQTDSDFVVVNITNEDFIVLKDHEDERVKQLADVLFSFILPMRETIKKWARSLPAYFTSFTNSIIKSFMGYHIAAYCVPSIIIDNDVVIRQVAPNVKYIEGIGLISTENIYGDQFLVIETTVLFDKFIKNKMNHLFQPPSSEKKKDSNRSIVAASSSSSSQSVLYDTNY